ncbi:E3 ubiquitin-protein ligase UPL5-like [Papaver somniferum]|uniref:E3 ubiquitin-protein ligase UPL5-like n=1 Tax=Papaver somniferum TaxID=3469 RepID=UPI000E6F76A5|nr:E3 ubiquitin-protein ligase UPL5-like [Papaver somniferum]
MKRDATGRVLNGNKSGSCSSSDSTKYVVGSSSSKSLHFFVRYSGGNTQVLHANTDDTVESVHKQIRKKMKIPVPEQGCIYYRGKKLEMDKTLEYYSIQKDAQLQLVARLRSTKYPKAWQLVSKGEYRGANTIVVDDVELFINMSSIYPATAFCHNQVFVAGGAAAALVMLGNLAFRVLRSVVLEHAKGTVENLGLSAFVSELGYKVIKGLDSCINPQQIAVMSLSDDVRNFIAFLNPLCKVTENGLCKMGFLPICLTDLLLYSNMELGTLHDVFLEMLRKIDECLKMMEISVSKTDSCRSEQGQYLSILKTLKTLSKLYQGAEENLLSVPRRHLTMMLLPEVKSNGHLFEMLINREQLLAESFEYISKADAKDLRSGRLFMEFKNEVATGPGVLREWFCAVCQAICNPQNALYLAFPDDRRRFFPNPASDVNLLYLNYFHFCGRVIALSLVYKVQVRILLDRTFFLQLAGKTVSLEDVRDADPLFYSSCKKILEMDSDLLDSDALALTFVSEVEKLGCMTTVELLPEGNSIALNSKNRVEYVNLLIQHRFVTSVSHQVQNFAEGFSQILGNTDLLAFFFRSLEHEDLDRMLHGSDKAICVEDWKAHTEYNGCKRTDSHIIWFWKIVEEKPKNFSRLLYVTDKLGGWGCFEMTLATAIGNISSGQHTFLMASGDDSVTFNYNKLNNHSLSSMPKWRVLLRRINKEKKRLFGSSTCSIRASYDPSSYSKNFDNGSSYCSDEEANSVSRLLTARFVDISRVSGRKVLG